MRTHHGLALLAAVASAQGLWSCAARKDPPAGGSSSSMCSDGPLYHWDSPFAHEDAPDGYDVNGGHNPPTCTVHCGVTQVGPVYRAYPFEALPSGSCATPGEICSLRAQPDCPCSNDAHPNAPTGGYFTFHCRCEGSGWRCVIINSSMVFGMGCEHRPGTPECRTFSDASSDG